MAYALENALYQWRDGDRRLAETPEPARADLDRAAAVVIEELRKRLGSTFLLEELADLYNRDTDWATELAGRHAAGTDSAAVVDAAFARYARESSNFAGGRARESHARP
jgi:choline dehydrogenase-like flavoprotein